MITALGTYLPPWGGPGGTRRPGPDEDAITIAVAAGRRALDAPHPEVARVVLVTRDLPLLEGGNGAVLLAGLGLGRDVEVVEQVGGAPATLDAVSTASPGTLVIGADCTPATGAAAALVGGGGGGGGGGGTVTPAGRVTRSLPLRVRDLGGTVREDEDPRLQRERGLRASLSAAGLPGKPVSLAGVGHRDGAAFCEGDPPVLPTVGASAALFSLAALAERGAGGLVAAIEQATFSAVRWDPSGVALHRDEPAPREMPARRSSPGPEIKIAFTAYDRAFDAKLGWEAGRCGSCATLAFPARHRCLTCGSEGDAVMVPLPRTGSVYTTTTVHVPVPGLETPYTLAVVELDDVGVRALVTVTDSPPGSLEIGDRGRLLLRRVAIRAGVPDYGYAFSPGEVAR